MTRGVFEHNLQDGLFRSTSVVPGDVVAFKGTVVQDGLLARLQITADWSDP